MIIRGWKFWAVCALLLIACASVLPNSAGAEVLPGEHTRKMAQSPSDTTSCVPSPSNLISWWTGDGNANDIIGTNDGQLQNGVAFTPGKVGQTFYFDGISSDVYVPNSPSLRIGDSITIEFWIYPNNQPNSVPVTQGDSNSYDPSWGILYYGTVFGDHEPQSVVFDLIGSSHGQIQTGAYSVPFGRWTHVAATSDGVTMRLYVNGVEVSSGSSTEGIASLYPLHIGSTQRNGIPEQYFNGMIDELGIYNQALTSQEIQKIYNASRSGKCKPLLIPTTGRISRYFLDTRAPDYSGDYYDENDNLVINTNRIHNGVNITNGATDCTLEQSPVYAAAAGTVLWAGFNPRDGYNVKLSHGTTINMNGKYVWTEYAQLGTKNGISCIAPGIVKGAYVSTGQLIGWQGDSGNARGVQLQWSIWVGTRNNFSTALPASPDFYTCIDLTAPSTTRRVIQGQNDCP
jgi:murein DD-endopeptidase MepM/ murein hydrolase activator NlpD